MASDLRLKDCFSRTPFLLVRQHLLAHKTAPDGLFALTGSSRFLINRQHLTGYSRFLLERQHLTGYSRSQTRTRERVYDGVSSRSGQALGLLNELISSLASRVLMSGRGRSQGSLLQKTVLWTSAVRWVQGKFSRQEIARWVLTIVSFAFVLTPFSSASTPSVTIRTDHPVYALGDRIVVRINVSHDGFLYLFNVRADGSVDLLVPNRFPDGDSRSWAGETRRFPEVDSGWWFVTPEPSGTHHLVALLATKGLKLDGLARFDAGNPFGVVRVRGLAALERALRARVLAGTTQSTLSYKVVKP